MIRNWKPWERSTGPKTEEGKEACKLNALKHGGYSAELKGLRRLLRRYALEIKENQAESNTEPLQIP